MKTNSSPGSKTDSSITRKSMIVSSIKSKRFVHKNLSVGFVVTHPFHGSPGSILRVRELSKSLSNFGVNVHVYSPYPAEEFWGKNVSFHKLPSLVSTLGLNNIVYGLSRRVLNNRFLARRVLCPKILDQMINSLSEALTETVKGEIDILQGEQEIAAAACVRAKKKLGIPIVSSLHNIWPEELVAMNIIEETSKQFSFLHELEGKIVTSSDLTVTVSEEMAMYLKHDYSLRSDKIVIVPPGGRARISKVRDRPLPFKVVYAGLVAARAQVDLFVKSIPFVLKKYPETKFYITQKGEQLQSIRRLSHEMNVHPEYYWFQKSATFYDFLSSCHVGIVTSSNDLPRRIGPAVKLFDYLSVGLPVVANNVGGWTQIIENEQIGVLTNDDPESFGEGIIKLLDDKTLFRDCSENGLELVKTKLNWDSSAKVLLEKYQDLSP